MTFFMVAKKAEWFFLRDMDAHPIKKLDKNVNSI
jgi:hypothetical protein